MIKLLRIFFAKEALRGDLDKAQQQGLITEQEKLRLTIERAEEKLREYLNKNKKK